MIAREWAFSRTTTAIRRGCGIALLSPTVWCMASAWQPVPPRQPEAMTFTGVAGERVGRWHGPSDRDAPVAIVFCERDASTGVAAVVPALWTSLEEHGIRSLTLDPMPTVPPRQSLVLDAGRAVHALRSQADMKPSAIGLIGVAASGAAVLVVPKLALDATFVTTIATDLAPEDGNRDVIASLAARGGPRTLLVFAATLQDSASISASLETLLKTPVRRPVDVSVLGEGQGVATIARDMALWIAERVGKAHHAWTGEAAGRVTASRE